MSESGRGAAAAVPEWTGRTVSHYQVLDRLGGGGMGVVYRARDTRLNREVALKFIEPASASSQHGIERFRREALAVSGLNHPNICTLYDVGTHDGSPFLVLELLEGMTLKDLARQAPLPARRVAEIGEQIADALEAAHGKGIVHRDVKPGNLLLTSRGQVKVLDFGLAKLVGPSGESGSDTSAPTAHALTEVGVTVGTLAYMAPEQLLGLPVDGRADVFSLGAVLHELATGRIAFGGPTASAVREAILHRDPAITQGSAPGTNEALKAVIARALEKDPQRRYPTAAAMRSDLQDIVAGDTALLQTTSRPRPAKTPRASFGRVVPFVAAAALALAAAGGAYYAGRLRPAAVAERTASVAVLPLDEAGGAAEFSRGAADLLVSALARVPGINVLSRSATQGYRGRELPPAQVARELGVDYLVEGTIERAGAMVRLTLSLVQADGRVAWSETYESGEQELFDVQRRAASALARAVLPGDREAAALAGGGNPVVTGGVETLRLYSSAQALLERPDVPGNVDGAIARLEKAVAGEPGFALGHAALAEACWARYRLTHEPDWAARARGAAEEALRLDPDQPLVRLSLAAIDEGTGRLEEARGGLEALVASRPDSDEARRRLGTVLRRLGRADEALAQLQKAVSLRTGSWQNHDSLGLAHLEAGRYPAAAASFERVIELQPDLAWGHQALGTVRHAQGDLASAVASYRRAIALGPDPLAWSNLGTALYAQGRLEDAAEAYRQAIALEPLASANHRNLGDALQRLGLLPDARRSWAEAARLGREALKVDPRSAETLGQLAVLEAKLGDHRGAEAHAGRALELAPADPDAHYRAAVVSALAGQAEPAMALLARAVALGYSRSFALDDDDLGTLRSRPDFQSLVAPTTNATQARKEEAR